VLAAARSAIAAREKQRHRWRRLTCRSAWLPFRRAPVAQRKSSGLLSRRSEVRILPGASARNRRPREAARWSGRGGAIRRRRCGPSLDRGMTGAAAGCRLDLCRTSRVEARPGGPPSRPGGRALESRHSQATRPQRVACLRAAAGGSEPTARHSRSRILAAPIRCRGAVAVAQLVEPRVVVPVVAGSNPVRHPAPAP
jgi:hypothetical protein